MPQMIRNSICDWLRHGGRYRDRRAGAAGHASAWAIGSSTGRANFRRRDAAGRHRPGPGQSSHACLLADEPTGNLDADTGDEIIRLLRDLNRNEGLTIIMVTHNLELSAETDRVVRLVAGRVESRTESYCSRVECS